MILVLLTFNSMSRGKKNLKILQRPPLEGAYIYVLSALLGLFAADLAILKVRPLMFPQGEPPARPVKRPEAGQIDLSAVINRNIFSSDGVIPPPITQGPSVDLQTPQPTSLPLQLMGTIVHLNPKKSVASIQVRGNPLADGYSPGKDIEGMAELVRVERLKAIFRNKSNGRLEFVEIKDEAKLSMGVRPTTTGTDLIEQSGNDFAVNREDVNKFLDPAQLTEVVKQARCVDPVKNPRTGATEGFRCVYVQPGSLIEKLGIRAGDVIKKVNGEALNNPTKAVSLLTKLRNATSIEIVVDRDGTEESLRYSIR